MSPITHIVKVGRDGNVVVPVGVNRAGDDVEVVVRDAQLPKGEVTPEQWREFVTQTAGSIADPTFARPPQGDYEDRQALE